ncbi:MAG TPA: hypothetical protein VGF06_18900 [Terriglobales bacterium]
METAATQTHPAAGKVQALVQLLRGRPYDEIRQRMYDNPPGSDWWKACKTELDIRNAERAATSSMETSRVLDKLKVCTEQLASSSEKFVQAAEQMTTLLKDTKESGRRMEIATYVIIANTIVQLFCLTFYFFGRR